MTPGDLLRPLLPLLLLALAAPASGQATVDEEGAPDFPRAELHGLLDVRFAAASSRTSWLDGGIGRTRYGGTDRDEDGLADRAAYAFHASQLSLVARGLLREDLVGHLHVNVDADDDRGSLLQQVGVVEAFVQWSPVLGASTRLRLRGGVTIPPFSLEHPEVAWSTRYTITPSAIATWLGEEVKSTGLEATLVWEAGSNELQLQGALFSANDPTGALLAWRGWALHDRQGQVGDELPLPPVLSLTDPRFFTNQGLRTEPFQELDGRPGWHAQARARLGPHALFQGGWYASNGDLRVLEPGDYTWKTRFALAGLQLDLGPLTVLGQYLDGTVEMGFVDPARVDDPIRAGFILASAGLGSTRLSARWDRFRVEDEDVWKEGKDLNDDDGWALTAAWLQGLGDGHRLQAEYVHVDVEHPFATTYGEDGRFSQDQVQVGWRLSF